MNTKIRMKTFKNENNKIITQKYPLKSKLISKEQIESYWNLFAVIPSYRIKFDNLCKTLPEIQREQIYETEYNRLDNLKNITNKLNAAVKEKFNLVNQIKSIDDYKTKQQSEDIITKLFHNLRETLIKLIELMNKLIHSYSYEFQNEKYNIDMFPVDFRKEIFYCVKNPNKMYMSFIFDGLDFIKNTFTIKNNFDFLLFNSIHSNSSLKLSKEDIFHCFNRMIFNEKKISSHIDSSKKRLDGYPNQGSAKNLRGKTNKEFIDAGVVTCNVHIQKDKKEQKVQANNENIKKESEKISKLLKIKHRKEKYYLFKGDITVLKDKYIQYYNTIPYEQKITFHLSENIFDLVKGIHPFMFIKYKEDGNIYSICTFSYSQMDLNSIMINHISNTNSALLKNDLNDIITCLNENDVHYKTIKVNLYWSSNNDNLYLNEDIHTLFKELKFKWLDLVNVDSNTRIQKMQYINNTTSNIINNNNYIHSLYLTLECGLMLTSSSLSTSIANSNNNNNKFLMAIFNSKGEMINDLYSLKVKYISDCNKNDLVTFIQKNSINSDKCVNIINKYYDNGNSCLDKACLYQVPLLFENMLIVNFKGKLYQRIETKIQKLIDNKTNQTFYLIQTIDEINSVVICEMNKEFRKTVVDKGNVYDNFYNLFESLENDDNSNVNVIYLPLRNVFKEFVSNVNGSTNEIFGIDYYSISKQNSNNDNVKHMYPAIEIKPTNNSIILNNNIFITVMNSEGVTETNENPIIFCGVDDDNNERT